MPKTIRPHPRLRRSSPAQGLTLSSKAKARKRIPHEFVLEALASLSPRTNPMFGCLAVYVGEKIVLILRDGREPPEDNGVWVVSEREHHQSLRRELPGLRPIRLFGEATSGWQVLPADSPSFEQDALCACDLILAGDSRIGRVPKSRGRKRQA